MGDKIEITELEPGKPLAYPVDCELEQHEAGCALWCSEFALWSEGLTIAHAKEHMVSKLIEQDARGCGSLCRMPAVRGTLLLRLSDNVLDPPDWPVLRVRLKRGKIVSREFVNHGVYSRSGFPEVGDKLPAITEWLAYETTGHHPENYYRVFDPRDGKWYSSVGPHGLNAISQCEVTVEQWHNLTKEWRRR